MAAIPTPPAPPWGISRPVVEDFNADWRSDHGQPGRSVRILNRSWYNPNLDSRWTMIPSLIGTLTMMGTLMLTAMSVAREREQGTFDQLLVTPFRPFEIMVGKAAPNMVIGLAQATTILLIAQFWFRIPFVGSFVVLYSGLGAVPDGRGRRSAFSSPPSPRPCNRPCCTHFSW